MKTYRGFTYPETIEELKNQQSSENSDMLHIFINGLVPVNTNVPTDAILDDQELQDLCESMVDEFRMFMGMDEEE